RKLARLAHVKKVATEAGYEITKVGPNGHAVNSGISSGVSRYSSIDGVFFTMDRLIVTSGRLPNPTKRYEVAMTADAARLLGLHLGGTFPLGVVGDVQSTNFYRTCIPTFHAVVKLVGIVTTSSDLIIDDTDRSPTIFTTA